MRSLVPALILLAACNDGGPAPSDPVEQPNSPPRADAGPFQTVLPGDEVRLTGAVTDPDGSIATFTWEQTDGPTVQLENADRSEARFVAPAVEGTTLLGFALTVVDEEGAADTARTSVLVQGGPQPLAPVVDAGPSQVVAEQTAVALQGTATDPDGTITSLAWTAVAGPAVTLAGADTLSPTFTTPSTVTPVEVVLALTATDDDGLHSTSTVTVLVTPENTAPTIDAGVDQTVHTGASVDLNATASDADGSIASVAWEQPAGPAVTLGDPAAASTHFVAPAQPATLVFQVTATDDEGATATDAVVVQVVDAPVTGQPPTVDAGADVEVDEGAAVTLAGTASDADGTVASTSWEQIAGPSVVLAGADTLAPDFLAPTVTRVELLVFRLEGIDDSGLASSDTVTVRVLPVNLPPLADAGADRSVIDGALVVLAGSASDPDGSVASTTWNQLSGPTVVLDDPTVLQPSFTAPSPGIPTVIELELVVTDDEGAVARDTIAITVGPETPANLPPEVYAGSDTVVGNGSQAQLIGAASDPDGTIASVLWTQVSGPAVTIDDPTALETGFVAPDVACAAALVFELTATDDQGATRSDRVSVVVEGDIGADPPLPVPVHLDLDVSDGAMRTEGAPWDWGVPTSGPLGSWNGANVWGTNVAGNYGNNQQGWLCLPPIDRAGASDATLSFRLYADHGNGDATWVEALVPDQGWVQLGDVVPAYDRVASVTGWAHQGRFPPWTLASVVLPVDLPDPVHLRFAFATDGLFQAPGAYLDEVRVDLESSDPDGDGLFGVRTEMLGGTDPFVADTDGDGVDDGLETDQATDPVDPSDFVGDPVAVAPFSWDFEGDSADLVQVGGLFAHGTPTAGNTLAHSGVNVWGTRLGGIYDTHERAWLYLPQVDLSATPEPTLSFRLWSRIGNGDALSLQIDDDGVWTVLAPSAPAYGASDPLGQAGFGTVGRAYHYDPVFYDLSAWAGQTIRLRFSFHTDEIFVDYGALIDDLAVHDEGSDPDGDGVFGIYGEYVAFGTDPFVADTDGDGVSDGEEVDLGSEPTNPADHPAVSPLQVGEQLDFELGPDRCVADEEGWAWGAVASGPGHAWNGGNGWGTNLTGTTEHNRRMGLYLPPVDLTSADDPVLSLRVWARHANGDATALQAWDPVERTWSNVDPVAPAYQSNGGDGMPGWKTLGYLDDYQLAAFSLAPWLGERVSLRLMAATDGNFVGDGAFIDEVRVDEDGSDPDADGFVGVTHEIAMGTDPFVADSDADGVGDGQELADGTDPTNPADWLGGPVWGIGERADLALDDGGLATEGGTWAYGAPAQGPLAGFTGDRAWATGLGTNHGVHLRESLYFPPLDLAGAVVPVVAARAWFASRDGLSFEVLDPVLGWTHVSTVVPAYDGTDTLGYAAWVEPTEATWGIVGADLSAWAGQIVHVRLVFRSDGIFQEPGVFLDDFALDDDSVDHDGDGLPGVLAEYGTHGTDPFASDTDGDGVDDGAEVGAGTDPLDPASF